MATSPKKEIIIQDPIIPLYEARRFIVDCMMTIGVSQINSELIADLLVEADYKGRFGQGMNLLQTFIFEAQHQRCDAKAIPKIEKESAATACVNGNNGFGVVVGHFCMDLAIKKAKDFGVAVVVAKGSNNFGMAGYYAEKALRENLIGFSFCNATPWLCPTRARDQAFGANALSMSAPGECMDSFNLDMATSVCSPERVKMYCRRGEYLPHGVGMNAAGMIETDPDLVMKSQRVVPLGGKEITSGYKGYGLSYFIESLTGILAGASYGPFFPNLRDQTGCSPPDIGHCFIAIDPAKFAPCFETRLSRLLNHLRNMEPLDPALPVLVPGDRSRLNKEMANKMCGVKYTKNQLQECEKIANELKVAPLKPYVEEAADVDSIIS